jgi:hypothetical protein
MGSHQTRIRRRTIRFSRLQSPGAVILSRMYSGAYNNAKEQNGRNRPDRPGGLFVQHDVHANKKTQNRIIIAMPYHHFFWPFPCMASFIILGITDSRDVKEENYGKSVKKGFVPVLFPDKSVLDQIRMERGRDRAGIYRGIPGGDKDPTGCGSTNSKVDDEPRSLRGLAIKLSNRAFSFGSGPG